MKGMKLEHIRIGKSYMWGDRRVEVRAITDALREGDPESEESDEDLVAGDVVTVAGVDEDGTPRWQYAPIADLRHLPVSLWAEDIRANYAHRYEPDPVKAKVTQPACGAVYEQWDHVPCGWLFFENDADVIHKRTDGHWNYRTRRDFETGTLRFVYEEGFLWSLGGKEGRRRLVLIAMIPDDATNEQIGDIVGPAHLVAGYRVRPWKKH